MHAHSPLFFGEFCHRIFFINPPYATDVVSMIGGTCRNHWKWYMRTLEFYHWHVRNFSFFIIDDWFPSWLHARVYEAINSPHAIILSFFKIKLSLAFAHCKALFHLASNSTHTNTKICCKSTSRATLIKIYMICKRMSFLFNGENVTIIYLELQWTQEHWY